MEDVYKRQGYSTTMWKIIFPMAKPSIITIILFNFLSFWNEYIISMTLMSSAKGPKTLPVGLLNLMQAQQSAACLLYTSRCV